MKLSVIIVSYNVRYFLEQCLHSVDKACAGLDTEIFVVDNASVDGSVAMLKEKFREVHLILNKTNVGFAVANNQAISDAKGEYILLLNPDTVVESDTFRQVIAFMDEHPDAGGLGVKMVDGKGKFLPESKRGLPTPDVAFFKIFGLSALFPKSKLFGRYHLGFLDKDQLHKVDVLSGAFMLLRTTALAKTGLLDETFFMYGEDIDLSYRLTQAGYANYYFPSTRIIHYKGESTRKGSLNYVFVFYNAMIIFAKKHFSQKNARLFSALIHIAIYLRAALALAHRVLRNIVLPIFDALLIFAGMYLITNYWEQHNLYREVQHYPLEFFAIAIPIYIFAWLTSVYILGGYDRPVRLLRIFGGLLAGTLIILVFYALLSEHYRFSRALIILGSLWSLISMLLVRLSLHGMNISGFKLGIDRNRRFVIIGKEVEAERVADLLRKTFINPGFIGLVSPNDSNSRNPGIIGHLAQLNDIISIYAINEVIFCAKDIPAQVIIDNMSDLQSSEVDFKIAPPESLSIIGSNSISTTGDLYVIDINSISKINNRRNKRLLDILTSIILLIVSPLAFFMMKKPLHFFANIFLVMLGLRSWIGYCPTDPAEHQKLPHIKRGILNPTDVYRNKTISPDAILRLNMLYVRDYKLMNDLQIIVRAFRRLGNA
ncbi:MAG: glycosyltransferase family 2 protein [Bacteroidales bacterium]